MDPKHLSKQHKEQTGGVQRVGWILWERATNGLSEKKKVFMKRHNFLQEN